MGVVDRRLELFEHIVRLRRAGQELPGNPDISAVRSALERELGDTVSRRLAARVLGVSHTALDRWITTGDLPVVYSPAGRLEVPVPALLDLHAEIEADEAEHGPRRHVLASTIARQRDAARRLRPDDLRPPERQRGGHDRATARGLAYHRVVARRLRRPMVDEARHVLFRWREQGRIDPRHADEWERVLARPVAEIRDALVDETPAGDDRRQSSPFAGMLSEAERRRIVREVR